MRDGSKSTRRPGAVQPIEKEYFRKDGSRVPVLIGATFFEEGGNQGVAFVLDLTERKRGGSVAGKRRQAPPDHRNGTWLPLVSGARRPADPHQSANLDYSGMRFEDFRNFGWEAFCTRTIFQEPWRPSITLSRPGTSYEAVHRLRRSDGEYRWYHARGEPLRDRQGQIVQWYGLSVDIDEAKKAGDQLRRSEAKLAEAQRLSRTGSWALAPTTSRISPLVGGVLPIWGFDPAQGLPYRAIMFRRIHSDDRDRVYEEAQEALRQKRDYKVDFRIVLPDGTVKHLEAIGHHQFSANGQLIQIVGTNIDVTARKRAEEALRESEAKFRDYAETASDWFWEIGPDYKFTLLTENAFGSDAGGSNWHGVLGSRSRP